MNVGRSVVAILSGIACTVITALLGLQLEFAIGVGVVLAAIVVVFGYRRGDDPRTDAPAVEEPSALRGSDVSRLAWAVNVERDTVGEMMTRRVRAILRRRLLCGGIDVDDPAAAARVDQRVGPGIWQRLTTRRAGIADVTTALDAADRLSERAEGSVPEKEKRA